MRSMKKFLTLLLSGLFLAACSSASQADPNAAADQSEIRTSNTNTDDTSDPDQTIEATQKDQNEKIEKAKAEREARENRPVPEPSVKPITNTETTTNNTTTQTNSGEAATASSGTAVADTDWSNLMAGGLSKEETAQMAARIGNWAGGNEDVASQQETFKKNFIQPLTLGQISYSGLQPQAADNGFVMSASGLSNYFSSFGDGSVNTYTPSQSVNGDTFNAGFVSADVGTAESDSAELSNAVMNGDTITADLHNYRQQTFLNSDGGTSSSAQDLYYKATFTKNASGKYVLTKLTPVQNA